MGTTALDAEVSPYDIDATSMGECEDDWIESPPPPPENNDSREIDSSHVLKEYGKDISSTDGYVVLNEGYTFSSDTMEAVGAADMALAAPILRRERVPFSDISSNRKKGLFGSEKIYSFKAEQEANEHLFHIGFDPSREDGFVHRQVWSSTEKNEPQPDFSEKSPRSFSLLQSPQRFELLRYLKECETVSSAAKFARNEQHAKGNDDVSQLESNLCVEELRSTDDAESIKDTTEINISERSDDVKRHSSFRSEEQPLSSRDSTLTMDEIIELGEEQISVQERKRFHSETRQIHRMEENTNAADICHPNLSPSTLAFLEMESRVVKVQGGDRTNPPESSSQAKKAFLRKGSRKEPSALRRRSSDKGHNGTDKDSSTNKAKLERLEKMQEDQRKQLEQRMKRRETARQEHQKRQIQKGSSRRDQRNKVQAEMSQNDQPASERGHACKPHKKATDATAHLQSIESPLCHANDKPTISSSIPHRQKTEEDGTESRNQNEIIAQKSPFGDKSSMQRSPLKPRNGNDENSDSKQEQSVQWKVLKGMKRRQEIALREAEREREMAKAWAAAERESVNKWASEQRALIKKERHKAATATMASQREKQQQLRKNVEANALSDKREKEMAEIEGLKATLQKLKVDMDAVKARHRLQEKKLKDKIARQNERIRQLGGQTTPLGNDSSAHAKVYSDTPEAALQIGGLKPQKGQEGGGDREKKPRNSEQHVHPRKHEQVADSRLSDNDRQPDSESKTFQVVENLCSDETMKSSSRNEYASNGKSRANHQVGVCPMKSSPVERTENERTIEDAFNNLIDESTEQWLERHLKGIQNEKYMIQKVISDPTTCSTHQPEQLASKISRSEVAIPPEIRRPLTWKEYNANNYCKKSIDRSSGKVRETGVTFGIGDMKTGPLAETSQNSLARSRREQALQDGTRVVIYRNGTKKVHRNDGKTIVEFSNGDTKISDSESGKVTYYYASAKTTHTTYPGGIEMYEFPNGQNEKHYPDGRREIVFPDRTRKVVFPNGTSETEFPDGVRVTEFADGTKQVTRF